MAQPPLKSPEPSIALSPEDEPITGDYPAAAPAASPARPRATPDFVLETVNAAESKMEGALKSAKNATISFNMLTTLVAVVAGAITGYVFLEKEARAQVDAGVSVVDQRTKATQEELARYKGEADERFKRLEHQGDRNETKLDAVLGALRVPNPAPKPSDAGQ